MGDNDCRVAKIKDVVNVTISLLNNIIDPETIPVLNYSPVT
jgi:hypothetical protein